VSLRQTKARIISILRELPVFILRLGGGKCKVNSAVGLVQGGKAGKRGQALLFFHGDKKTRALGLRRGYRYGRAI
jgi:hypothetical protein